jgi:acyl-CoA synthetase (AMP-forming)/AMP-acid ligase II
VVREDRRLADDAGSWDRATYPELALDARRVAADLAGRGIGRGDVVAVAAPASREGLAAMFGTWAAGATLCMLPAPGFTGADEYVSSVLAIRRVARPAVTFGDADAVGLLDGAEPVRYAAEPLDGTAGALGSAAAPLARVPPSAEVAAVQFTSGSTGSPRGIELTWDNLESNLAVIERWTGWRDGDAVASWLPLNHDMGFVGCLLFMVANQGDLWLMTPGQFVRSPTRWLWALSSGRACHTTAPPFGYAYAARRGVFDGLDLSSWRTAIVGAATIEPSVLRSFTEAAAPAGFSPDTFLPAYGLAENTVAVTGSRAGRAVRPDWRALNFGEPVPVAEAGSLWDAGAEGWLTGHGLPEAADGIGVRIEDPEGAVLPAGSLGEIVVTGTSVARGYSGHPPFGTMVRTGDAGFIAADDLYVLGRMGESLKVRARSVYVEDLDGRAASAAGFERIAVIAVSDGGRPGVAVFAEARPGPWAAEVVAALRAELGPEPAITVIAGRRGLIRRTSSGKPRRREMWRLWAAGELSGVVVE